ncbi:hypothetical protein C1645_738186 [Glomus cerebriforme]|uniref:ORC1/DEAH AAA+ ATPase domain-containing protein n=1 Tax=Glomus cerebriforme TaxID=658196 RepID=A0A397T1P8_9GLOM|nr:hypothetical protein C1645_738186 [Glomus cerebriforme]
MQKIYINIYVYIYASDVAHFFYFYFSKSFTNFSPPLHISSEASIFIPAVVGLLVSILIFFISGDVIYAWGRSKYNEYLLNKTVEEGIQPKIDISNDEFVSRPLAVDRLKKILQPHRNHSYYHVICGEHGTGKTTLARIASNEVGCGVIYVDIPANPNQLGKAFRKAINFAFEEVSYTGQMLRKIKSDVNKPKISEWEKALEAFNHASEVYKAKHDKPMVIVDDAKYSADNRKYIAVFVSSDEKNGIAWSRAKPVMEIVIKQQVLTEVEKKFQSAQLLPNDSYYEVGKSIIKDLLNSKELSFLVFKKYFNKAEGLNEVLGSNIFSYHPEKNIVTFQSQSVEFYIRENTDIFIK